MFWSGSSSSSAGGPGGVSSGGVESPVIARSYFSLGSQAAQASANEVVTF